MKRTKKFASLLLALVMVFAMSVTAFAAGTNTITVKTQFLVKSMSCIKFWICPSMRIRPLTATPSTACGQTFSRVLTEKA